MHPAPGFLFTLELTVCNSFDNLLANVEKGQWMLIVSRDGAIGNREYGRGLVCHRNFTNMDNLPVNVDTIVFKHEPPEDIRQLAEGLIAEVGGTVLDTWEED